MDYNFSWPRVRIEPRLRLSRSLALVGVLRELSQDVPDDAVLLYLINNDCSGLKDSVFSELYRNVSVWGNQNPTLSNPLKNVNVPDALRTMANEYFMTLLITEIYTAVWASSGNNFSTEGRVQVMPRKVREALDGVPITAHATVQDHKVMIDALKASISIDSFKIADPHRSDYDYRSIDREMYWKQQDFDILSPKQLSKIFQLRDMFCYAISKMKMERKLLNPYEWSTLCDLIDLILILTYSGGFIEASNLYSLYEYSKMAESGRERAVMFSEPYQVSHLSNLRGSTIDKALSFYSKLSPKAALMTVRNVRLNLFRCCEASSALPLWYEEERAIRKYLEFKRQPVSTAVKLFMKYEIAIQRKRIWEISMTLRKQSREGNCCCADDPCEAPSGYC